MADIQRQNDKAPLRPGHWRHVIRDESQIIKVACPMCGGESAINEYSHKINHNGVVSPSLRCPRSEPPHCCDWDDHVRLLGFGVPD